MELSLGHFGLGTPTRDELLMLQPEFLSGLYILAYMYAAMGGIDWVQSTGWPDAVDVCEMDGVDCLFVNLLNSLSLPNNNLIGTIPDDIGRLQGIRSLDLSNNKGIHGTIPSSLSSMTSLDVLDLSGCSLTGT